ncbi:hypothetical protein DFA_02325 [Cavenderia fasciculata]|uniref:Ankyrin repeat-containing protein n=1 Tax=Cavenderia fasciculata TaxID=261658 RepID=F4PZ50_CACFS|nr:uncharacterized protein DFA_02325 [Cavenderia fasciculata]EGG19079.1 hypothetical protein DFA_02325 [Cavenderia fasciculata]|eukprot:XP_004366712.1 hypothetical protein DFA_02325 [Cavenderia fasciculata]
MLLMITTSTFETILRNKYLFSQVKYWIRRLEEEDHDKRTDLPRIYHYDHWSRVSDMLRNGHVGLLMDKLKRNINVSFSNDTVELICLKVKDLVNFKILSFIGENLVGCACRAGNPEIVKILLEQEYPTPLPTGACFQQAMSKGRYEVLTLLLARGLKYNKRYDTSRFGTFKFIESLDWLSKGDKDKDKSSMSMVGHRLRKEVTEKIALVQKFKEAFPHVDVGSEQSRTSSLDLYNQHCTNSDIRRDIQQRAMVHGTLDFLKLIHKKHPEWVWKDQYAYSSAMDSGRTDILDYVIDLIVSDGPHTFEETFESVAPSATTYGC